MTQRTTAFSAKTGWTTAIIGIPLSVLLTTIYTAGIKAERLEQVCVKLDKVELTATQALKESAESKIMFGVVCEDIREIKSRLKELSR
ncbi:MAG: hypothetical protein EOM20_16220 [Spartobacteria bacterium]|nr:hypothetical protein [Spartobacteria bacterium]